MCTTCGCSIGQLRINNKPVQSHHQGDEPFNYRNSKIADNINSALKVTKNENAHTPQLSQTRMLKIERDILAENNRHAADNRNYLASHRIFALNLVSSPGSGKTTLLVNTILMLRDKFPIAVIEGDQQTDHDAMRIRATGVPAIQINTGKGCHLDAQMVDRALQQLPLKDNSLLFVENVGNLVCPASFDLGEAHKVIILSVTEGEDKPLKYPDMFHASDLMVLNKCDLLPHLAFDVDLAIEYAHRINPVLPVIQVSASEGSGLAAWVNWIETGYQLQQSHHEF